MANKSDLLRLAQDAFNAGDNEKGFKLFLQHEQLNLPEGHPTRIALSKDRILTPEDIRIRATIALNVKGMVTADDINKAFALLPAEHKDGGARIIIDYIRERVEPQLPGTLAEILRHVEGYKPN